MINFEAMRLIPVRLWAMAVLAGILIRLSFPVAGPVPVWRTALCWFAQLLCWGRLPAITRRADLFVPSTSLLLGYCCSGFVSRKLPLGIRDLMHTYGGIAKPAAVGILILFCSWYLGLYNALYGAIIVALRRSPLHGRGTLFLSPFVWAAVQNPARARITGFPWDLLGTTHR